MFKVECLGCQAPYQVDERRVPATGLQMRCPKCGTSFKVESPAGASVGSKKETGAQRPAPFAPMSVSPTAVVGREALSRTMIGVTLAAPTSPKVPFRMPRPGQGAPAQVPAVEPEASQDVSQGELPAVLTGNATVRLEDAPDAVAVGAELAPPAVVEVTAEQDDEVPESLAAPSRPMRLSELPLPVAVVSVDDPPPVAVESALYDELPDLASVDDLPDAPSPPGVEVSVADDLPAVPARPKRPPPPRREKKEVPAALPVRAELPVRPEADLPAIAEVANLPVAGALDPSAHLPALPGVGLPRSVEPAVGLGDLPSVLGGGSAQAELPSVLGGGTAQVELPSVLGGALVDAELPSPTRADMPSPVVGGAAGFGRVALPEVHAGLPSVQAGLPEMQGGLPVVQSALPEVQGALPEIQGALPEVQGVLPVVQGALPEVQGVLPEVQGDEWGSSALPVVGEVLPAIAGDNGFGDNTPGQSDEAFDAGADFSFGETGPDESAGFSFPPEEEPFGDAQPSADEDPFASAQFDPLEEPSNESSDGFGMEASLFPLDAGDTPEGIEPSTPSAPSEEAGYGEVSIGGEVGPTLGAGLDTADDMEFGDIPQEQGSGLGDIDDPGSDREAPGATLELDGERKRPVRRLERRVAIAVALGLGIVGGGAMSLQPQLGPFGIHYVLDEVHRSENERSLSTLQAEAVASFGKDTLDDARAAIVLAESAAQRAPRFHPFAIHLATLLHAAALRFGPLSEMEAAGKAALTGLAEQSTSAELELAKSAAKAARLELKAIKQLQAVVHKPEAKMLLLELHLQLNQPQEALTLLEKSSGSQSARTQFVAARAQIALGQWQKAFRSAGAVLALNPEHAGANIVRLDARRGGYSGEPGEAAAEHTSIAGLTKKVEQTLPRSAPAERVLAHEVRGDLHLKYGRETQAQKEFEAALALNRQSPRALIGLGETLLLAGRHAEALARFEAAMAARPENLRANLGVVEAQLTLDHLGKANELVKTLLKKHPENAEIVYWQAQAEQALGNTEAALLAYRAAIDLGKGRPDSMPYYLALSQLEGQIGQTALAAATLNEARTRLPPSGLLLHAMGQTAMQDGKYASALGFFEDAAKLDPEDTRASFLGAVALTRLGRFDEALRAFNTVKASDQSFPGLAMERGRLFEVSSRNDEALEQYEAAFIKSPNDNELKLRLSCSRVVGGQGETAIALLEELVKSMPRSAEVHYCLGRAFFEKHSYVRALSLLGKAVRLDDTQAVYHLYEGWVANDVGKTAQAASSLDRALDLDNGLGDAYWLRGRLSRKQGAVKDALKDLRRAQKLTPERVEVLADLAAAYTDLGQRSKALKAWRIATDRQPKNAIWRFRYGKLLSAMGQGQRATTQLMKALELAQPEASPAGIRSKATLPWMPQAHYLIARTMGRTKRSVMHWQAFLSGAPEDNPYRKEAQKALKAMGESWKKR